MLWKRDRLFCDINPVFYKISRQKEIIKRHLKNLFRNDRFAVKRQKEKLPNTVHEHTNNLIKQGLEKKLDAMVMRELYTKYKNALMEEEKEKARKEYLDRRGVPESFRW